MSNNDQVPVMGSRLKMKIKFSHSSSSTAPISSSDTQLAIYYELAQNSSDPIPSPTHTPSPPRDSPSNMVGSSHGLPLLRKRKSFINGAQNHDDVTTRTMIQAEEVQSTLGYEFPSFIKVMNRSHIINPRSWMGVPGKFGKEQLPRTTIPVILVDESEKYFEVSYLGKKMGFSGGWRNFAVEQNLVENDVLIFQLLETKPCKFKVYVVRATDFEDVEAALNLLHLKALKPTNHGSSPPSSFEN